MKGNTSHEEAPDFDGLGAGDGEQRRLLALV
jgi:hypothetical protein